MKKEKKSLLTLSVLGCGLLLSGCGETIAPSTGPSSDDHVCSVDHSCSVEPEYVEVTVEVPVEVEKKFGVTINAAEGTTVTIVDPQESYSAGSTLNFTVSVNKSHLDLDQVKYNGKALSPDAGGVYSVTVVNSDAAIETSVFVRGEENLLEVSDVDPSVMPTTPEAFKAVLEAAKEKEAKYASSAKFDTTYDETKTLEAEIGYNNVVHIKGRKVQSTSSTVSAYQGYERGVADGRFYEIDDDTQSVTFSRGATVQSIVSDDSESVLASQIKASDADIKSSTSGFIDDLLTKTFTHATNGFLATDNYGWKEIKVSSEMAQDGKSYFAKASAYYSSYRRIIEFVAEIDGDGFLKNAHLVLNDYNSGDIEDVKEMVTPENGGDPVETTVGHRPVEGAEPKKTQELKVDFTRGYRSRLDKTDLTDFVTRDYDVLVDYKMPGEYSTSQIEGSTVYNSARLSFRFRQKEYRPVYIIPTLIGAKEDGFITWDETTPIVSNVGDFTLQFDNGFGDIKEVSLTSVRPDAKSISASLNSSKVYNGATAILTPAISPEGADQSVTVELSDDSTCEVTIEPNADGTYSITGVTNGSGELVVTSVANPTLSTTVSFTVEDKPNADAIKAFLLNNTLFGKVSGWGSHFVNFYEDGTGEYVCYESGKGDIIPFMWSLDEESFILDIEVDGTLKSKYYNFGGFSELTSSSVEFEYLYNGSSKFATLTALDEKLDLVSATNLGDY